MAGRPRRNVVQGRQSAAPRGLTDITAYMGASPGVNLDAHSFTLAHALAAPRGLTNPFDQEGVYSPTAPTPAGLGQDPMSALWPHQTPNPQLGPGPSAPPTTPYPQLGAGLSLLDQESPTDPYGSGLSGLLQAQEPYRDSIAENLQSMIIQHGYDLTGQIQTTYPDDSMDLTDRYHQTPARYLPREGESVGLFGPVGSRGRSLFRPSDTDTKKITTRSRSDESGSSGYNAEIDAFFPNTDTAKKAIIDMNHTPYISAHTTKCYAYKCQAT